MRIVTLSGLNLHCSVCMFDGRLGYRFGMIEEMFSKFLHTVLLFIIMSCLELAVFCNRTSVKIGVIADRIRKSEGSLPH